MVGYCFFSHQIRALINPILWIVPTPNYFYKFQFPLSLLLQGSNLMGDADDGSEEEEEEDDDGKLFDSEDYSYYYLDLNEEDRISALPDDILSSILSFLTMKEEVRTLILSKRFKSVSSSRQNLDFDFPKMFGFRNIQDYKYYSTMLEDGRYRRNNPRFVEWVCNLLRFYSCITKIYCFRVSFSFGYPYSEDHKKLPQWIQFALDRGVESIQLICSYRPSKDKTLMDYHCSYHHYEFPCHLLLLDSSTTSTSSSSSGASSSLKHLQLKTCRISLDRNLCQGLFINTLITIDLEHVLFGEDNLLESLLSSCLFLQVLKLRQCCLIPVHLNVASPCLKCFDLLDCSVINLSISASNNLTTFRYINDINFTHWVNFSFNSLPQLERLLICFSYESEARILSILTKLPQDLPCLESLYLSCVTMEMPTLPMKLASFTNLKQLEVHVSVHATIDLLWIASTVNALPLLVKLNVMLDNTGGDKTQGNIRAFGYQPHYQLKEVLVNGFCAYWNEIELIICLLKTAVALEHMVIDPRGRCIGVDGKWEQWEPRAMKWNEEEDKERVYEVMHKETPRITNLVNIL